MTQLSIHGRPEPVAAGDWLTTPFEDWCEGHGVHPEERGAWELYEFFRIA